MSRIKKAVIPVGGLGTRFLPITKAVPKEMLPLVDIPIIYYIIKEAVDSGIEDILVISNYNKISIENYFTTNKYLENKIANKPDLLQKLNSTNLPVKIHFIYEKEPVGNGATMLKAKEFVGNDSFAVMWGDDIIKSNTPALKQLMDVFDKYAFNVIGVQKVNHDLTNKYGIVDFKNFDKRELKGIIEKPNPEEAPSDYAVIGRYIVSSQIFYELENINKNKGEYYFTDALKEVIQYQVTHACIIDGTYYDTGSKLGYMKATTDYALADNEIKDEYYDFLKEIIK